jgi:hypothetical protein
MRLNPWTFVVIWLLLAAGVAVAYSANRITGASLVFFELCVVILGGVGIVFWRKMTDQSRSVEEMLYGDDKTKEP